MSRLHRESHLVQRIGWLRAAVLGANDGIVSTASLIVDGLGLSEFTTARPMQVALTSGATSAAGAVLPLAMVFLLASSVLVAGVATASLLFLALLGARTGGANVTRATLRVTFWGALAMVLTAGIGAAFGTISR